MVSYSFELFERLAAGGEPVLRSTLRSPESEGDHLDFKQVATPSGEMRSKGLRRDDSHNFGKALGGFSNSGGGVIVWGPKCDSREEPDVRAEREVLPILTEAEVDALERKLREQVGNVTTPQVSGVDFRRVAVRDGFVLLMHVPEGRYKPVRTNVGLNTYYFRAADGFFIVSHDVLAGLFGQPPSADMVVRAMMPRGSNLHWRADGGVSLSFEVTLGNVGRGIATDAFFSYWFDVPGPNSELKLSKEAGGVVEFVSSFENFGYAMTRSGVRIPPGALIRVAMFELVLKPPFERDFRVEYKSGATSSMTTANEWRASRQRIAELYDELFTEKRCPPTIEIWKRLVGMVGLSEA